MRHTPSPSAISRTRALTLLLCLGFAMAAWCIPTPSAAQQSQPDTLLGAAAPDSALAAKLRATRRTAANQQKVEQLKLSEKAMTTFSGLLRAQLKQNAAGLYIEANPMLRTRADGSEVQVVLEVEEPDSALIAQLRASGVKIELQHQNRIQAWVETQRLPEIANMVGVQQIKPPSYPVLHAGSVTTAGDTIMRSNLVRNMGLAGEGIKVGVISDGANNLADAQASGDLPNNVVRYGSCTRRNEVIEQCLSEWRCNEGTAMAEIVHDIAPQAEIAIAAVGTSTEFLQRLDQLVNDFGADIIVDDLGFFGEPYFEDGNLAQAVNNLPDDVLYVSSAGNSGGSHYEEDFKLGFDFTFQAHEFDTNDVYMGYVVPARGYVFTILQWNDNFNAPTSDFDLYSFSNSVDSSASFENQSAPGIPPIEGVCVFNSTSSDRVDFILIDKFSGANKRLEMFSLASPGIEYPIPAGSVFGHAGVPKALAIGTINADEPNQDEIAFYSSQGPSRIDFPNRQDRPKPDLTGIDGVRVTGAGGFPSTFFGTSAAAPHVAGVAALLMSAGPRVSAESVREALIEGAVDLGGAGFDSTYGYGRVDALSAKELLKIGFALPPYMLLLDDE